MYKNTYLHKTKIYRTSYEIDEQQQHPSLSKGMNDFNKTEVRSGKEPEHGHNKGQVVHVHPPGEEAKVLLVPAHGHVAEGREHEGESCARHRPNQGYEHSQVRHYLRQQN